VPWVYPRHLTGWGPNPHYPLLVHATGRALPPASLAHGLTLLAYVSAPTQRPRRYSERWSERQRAEKFREKNLIARALKVEETGALSVGARRERFHPIPPAKSRCREAMQSALRML
jgi:hypothetical protein